MRFPGRGDRAAGEHAFLGLRHLDARTPEDEIASLVDRVRGSPRDSDVLVGLLAEQHPLYTGRSANETSRIRGYVLASFASAGLPDAAVPYVVEELESGRSAYLVAAAARAVRGGARDARFVPYLFRAIENVKSYDDTVTFDCYRPRWPLRGATTALAEIFATFGWLGGEAACAVDRLQALLDQSRDEFSLAIRRQIERAIALIRGSGTDGNSECCPGLSTLRLPVRPFSRWWTDVKGGDDVTLEDQDGRTASLDEWLRGKPAIVTFFYTRCDNPNKCSLTVTRLARLQHAIRARGLAGRIRTMAITYDPGYDRPDVLKAYADNRGVSFSDDDRFVRTTGGFDRLRRRFELGVNFGPATVNRHRIELFVLDAHGRIAATFARLQWDVDAVLDEAVRLLPSMPRRQRASSHVLTSPGLAAGAMLALTPKCPMCWTAYMSAVGIAGVDWIPYDPRVRVALVVMILVNLGTVALRAAWRRGRLSAYAVLACAAGTLGMLVAGMALDMRSGLTCGAILIAIGSVLSTLSTRTKVDAASVSRTW